MMVMIEFNIISLDLKYIFKRDLSSIQFIHMTYDNTLQKVPFKTCFNIMYT